ncbi:MAG: OmpH family outer membrane protein [Alphaproteobacteria bacterium]|nr:OmpH family outer membrane protein [Alphaproteobacteria bacterium]
MIIKIFLIFIVISFSTNALSTNIKVLDFQHIIENNINISNFYDKIDKDQIIHKENFKKEELNLKNELERIEKLKLILESAELEKEIENYNNQLNNFNDKIQKFNLHYEIQINNFKNRIVNIILEILKQYSEDNKIDLVLDSNNYVLSSNSINITDIIKDKVNNKSIEINFEKY